MRFWTILALLTAIMGGAAITATADAYSCTTECNPTVRTCTTRCF